MSQDVQWKESGVSIIVPTFKRPEAVVTALNSLLTQDATPSPLEIIVVDNDPDASARDAVKGFIKTCPIETHYLHVPEPGVSNARNGAMAAARGRYLAFLDDDMEATQTWLSSLLDTTQTHNASVCFGPIEAVLPPNPTAMEESMQPYFSRHFDGGDGLTSGVAFGMGGCLLDLQRCDMPSPPFNPDMNECGGEDDWLFSLLISRGAEMAWSPKAMTYEHVPRSRLTLKYFWKRNFAFGQGPTQACADEGAKGAPGVMKWMLVGAVQSVLSAPLYALFKLLKRPSFVVYYAKLAQGTGKMFWWDSFSPRIYGASAVGNKAA